MSVLIKGMKMPRNCMECEIKAWEEGINEYMCPFSGIICLSIGRQDDCTLVELPEKHGRLFDETEVKRVLHDLPDGEYKWGAIALLEWAVEKRRCVEAEGE